MILHELDELSKLRVYLSNLISCGFSEAVQHTCCISSKILVFHGRL